MWSESAVTSAGASDADKDGTAREAVLRAIQEAAGRVPGKKGVPGGDPRRHKEL